MLAAGTKAPEFILDRLDGGKQSLEEILSQGPALLAIYKISCPVCQMRCRFSTASRRDPCRWWRSPQDDERGTHRFRESLQITMPTLLDRERDGYPVSNAFGITHVPSLFLVEQDGTISLASVGFVKSDLEQLGKRSAWKRFVRKKRFRSGRAVEARRIELPVEAAC